MNSCKYLLLLAFATPSLLFAQADPYPLGVVIDSVVVTAQPGESFALYLPTAYRENEPSPVVFIFDPAARGRQGIRGFIKAAERYNYVLVCSNNSRNGPYDQNFQIAGRLFDQVLPEFSIDPKRIYTAGFSGGARLASAIADLTGQIQGVVACGAGFSGNGTQLPASGESYSYVGLVGNEDFNYGELVRNSGWLNKLGISNALFEYDMGHRWPSQDQMLLAFHWLELEAQKQGLVQLERDEWQGIYEDFYTEARMLEAENQLVRAHASYSRILNTLADHFGLDSIAQRLGSIETRPAYADQKRQRARTLEEEVQRLQQYYRKLEKDAHKAKRYPWWEAEIEALQKSASDPNPYTARMAKRILASLRAFAWERGESGQLTELLRGIK